MPHTHHPPPPSLHPPLWFFTSDYLFFFLIYFRLIKLFKRICRCIFNQNLRLPRFLPSRFLPVHAPSELCFSLKWIFIIILDLIITCINWFMRILTWQIRTYFRIGALKYLTLRLRLHLLIPSADRLNLMIIIIELIKNVIAIWATFQKS